MRRMKVEEITIGGEALMVLYGDYRKCEGLIPLILPVLVEFRDIVQRTLPVFHVLKGWILRIPHDVKGHSQCCPYFVV